jgi:hypothetical protein
MEINVTNDTTKAIHINFTLSFIFHIPANTLKLNRVKIENRENTTQYDNNIPEKANFVHKSIYHTSLPNGIRKLINNIKASPRYV